MGINVRSITGWLVSLVLLMVVTLGLMKWLMTYFSEVNPNATATRRPVTLPVSRAFPQLNANQPEELLATREMAHRLLSEYAWLDQPAGVARIPIRRAMDILAQDGLSDMGGPSGEGRENE